MILENKNLLDIICSPLQIEMNEDYSKIVTLHLKAFQTKLKEHLREVGFLESDVYTMDTVIMVSESIINILNLFNSGRRNLIHEEFKKLMNEGIKNIVKNTIEVHSEGSKYYRIRSGEINTMDRTKYDIFHIPFNKRYLISNSRFNGSGTPCLYLANNPMVAWRECNKPKLDTVNLGIFCNSQPVRFLDFSLKNKEELVEHKKFLKYVCLYPIIMAIHTKINYKGALPNFKIEYLFPSLLMDWFQTEDEFFDTPVLGIKYHSVKSNSEEIDFNYALKTEFDKNFLYCQRLEGIFLNGSSSFSYKYYYSEDFSRKSEKLHNDTFNTYK